MGARWVWGWVLWRAERVGDAVVWLLAGVLGGLELGIEVWD